MIPYLTGERVRPLKGFSNLMTWNHQRSFLNFGNGFQRLSAMKKLKLNRTLCWLWIKLTRDCQCCFSCILTLIFAEQWNKRISNIIFLSFNFFIIFQDNYFYDYTPETNPKCCVADSAACTRWKQYANRITPASANRTNEYLWASSPSPKAETRPPFSPLHPGRGGGPVLLQGPHTMWAKIMWCTPRPPCSYYRLSFNKTI